RWLPPHAPHMREMKKRHGVAPGRLPISPSMTETLHQSARRVKVFSFKINGLARAPLTVR
ncbi:MAG: hypothetical protein RI979_2363, partial [Pseudomonadota bacterium]